MDGDWKFQRQSSLQLLFQWKDLEERKEKSFVDEVHLKETTERNWLKKEQSSVVLTWKELMKMVNEKNLLQKFVEDLHPFPKLR